ncbi:MAG: hypothetical protein DI538_00500 [Azospira oryzae]|jgi:hypothetical protein|nr:MAG: hypothetical protein DI538_00500 [Azospira oryzae]
MARVQSCPACGKGYELQLSDTWLLMCPSCQEFIYGNAIKGTAGKMPADWSWIKMGTTGVYDKKKFSITGRVRIQTQHDVMNLWCARCEDKSIWINHTTDSLRVYGKYTAVYVEVKKNPVGEMIRISDKYSLRCESKGECNQLHAEGEVSSLPIEGKNFEVLKASNATGNSALIFKTTGDGPSPFLWGAIMEADDLKFQNTIALDEWK